MSKKSLNLRMTFKPLFTFFVINVTCSSQVNVSSITNPSDFVTLILFIWLLAKVIGASLWVWWSLLWEPITMYSVLLAFRLNLYAFIQSETFIKSSSQKSATESILLLDVSSCVSSANILHLVCFKQLGKSLTYIRNNSGYHWGIPQTISSGWERWSFPRQYCFLFDK